MTNIKEQTVFTNAIQVTKIKVLTTKNNYTDAVKKLGGGSLFGIDSSTSGKSSINFIVTSITADLWNYEDGEYWRR